MPKLTVRSLAEMLDMTAYEQVRVLTEQKYPAAGSAPFRAAYYGPALAAINRHYRVPGSTQGSSAVALSKLNPPSKAQHNLRVLSSFYASAQAARQMSPVASVSDVLAIGSVAVKLKLKFDFCGTEMGHSRYVFYNCRAVAIDVDTAKKTLEIAHMCMSSNTRPIQFGELEYVDLVTGAVHKIIRVRVRTASQVNANAKIITTLWPSI